MGLQPIDYYDATQWDIDDTRPLLQRETVSIELMRPLLGGAPGRLLDVGCGNGFFLEHLDRKTDATARGWQFAGVDYSQYTLDKAARLPYEFARCNLEEGIPHADDSFDLVFAGEIIEHLYNPDLLLAECRRVLKPGGHVVITTPNLHVWYNRALFALGIQPLFYETSTKSTQIGAGAIARLKKGKVPVGHLRVFNRRALLDLLGAEGFEPLALKGAIFQSLPVPLQRVDAVFNRRPSLASNLVVLARAR